MGPPRGKKRSALGEHSPGHEITDLDGENVNGYFAGLQVVCKDNEEDYSQGLAS